MAGLAVAGKHHPRRYVDRMATDLPGQVAAA
jgi:hypothetical protein